MDLSLLPLAMGPAALLVHVAWMLDAPRREPWRNVLRYVIAGVVSSALAWLTEGLATPLLVATDDPGTGWPLRLLIVFVGIAMVEEGWKYFCLTRAAQGDHELDEPFDWVVYAVAVALGFAAVENVRVLWQGAGVGWVRAWTAVPAHALDGTLMGCRLAAAMRAGPGRGARQRWLALVEPALWHTAYDHLLFQVRATPGPVTGLFVLWFAVVGAQWIVAARRVSVLWKHAQGPPPILLPLESLSRLRGKPEAGPPAPPDDDGRP
jgi:RsiW-degrading membrane proteinase PrsW (M82 family)